MYDITISQVQFEIMLPAEMVNNSYRDYWFYLEETDHDSRGTFLLLAELFRLGLTETKARQGPVLTLPVGGP